MNASAESMQRQVIVANQEFYRQIAGKYDDYEACASDIFFQQTIEKDLDLIETRLRRPGRNVRCLDCGGGTGNLTLKMLRCGWNVTVVDVSADMLKILEQKTKALRDVRFICDSVESFLATDEENFEVIAFSSVLHHLYSPVDVVKMAARRVVEGGFFYSIFDPVIPRSRFHAAWFSALDTLIAKLQHDRRDLLPGIARRSRKFFAQEDKEHGREIVSAGDLAEYHARHGLDDQAIEAALTNAGFSVERRRYPAGRSAAMRWVNARLQALPNFSILAQKQRAGT